MKSQYLLEQQINQFSNEHWPDANFADTLAKLLEEVGELAETICNMYSGTWVGPDGEEDNIEHIKEEAADCNIVLTRLLGLMDASLLDETAKKFEIIRKRPRERKKIAYENWKYICKKLCNDEEATLEDVRKVLETYGSDEFSGV